MKWGSFFIGFLVVILLYFAKSQITNYWVPIEFSFFLIFFIIRSSNVGRALAQTLVLSLCMDLIFHTGQVKGLSCMGQLVLVYAVFHLKRHVTPFFEDIFLIGFFAFFYLANYYISLGLSGLFRVYYQTITPTNLLFLTLFHTTLYSLMVFVYLRFNRGSS